MYLIVGLGNPDKKYDNTFHNVGFSCIDEVAKRLNVEFNKGECRAVSAHALVNGTKVILAKPITYMNLSGDAIVELINKYKIEQDKFCVIYDDVDMDIGKLRLRQVGSAGTHNGAKSIVTRLNTTTFNRIRIGIGKPPHEKMSLADFVLSKINTSQQQTLDSAYQDVVDAIVDFVNDTPYDKIMQKYNSAKAVNVD